MRPKIKRKVPRRWLPNFSLRQCSLFLFTFSLLCVHTSSAQQKKAQPELVIQNTHSGDITAVTCSPLGNLVATSGNDFTIRLWELKSGMLFNVLTGHSSPISSIAFSPSGRQIVSGSSDGTVRVWDIETGKVLGLFRHDDQVNVVAFSHDGRMVASGSGWYGEQADNSIRVWDIQSSKQLWQLIGHTSRVTALAFTYNGKFLVSGGNDGTIRAWSLETGGNTFTEDNKYTGEQGYLVTPFIGNILVNPDKKTIATIVSDKHSPSGRCQLQTRSLNTWSVIRSVVASCSPIISSDWKWSISTDDERVTVRDFQNSRVLHVVPESSNNVDHIAISSDGRSVITVKENVISIWDTKQGYLTKRITNSSVSANAAVYNFNNTMLAWANGSQIKIWDTLNGSLLFTLQAHASRINSLVFSSDGRFLASGSENDNIKIWSVENGKLLRSFGPPDDIYALAFSPNGQILASTSGHDDSLSLCLWDFRSGRLLRRISVPPPSTSLLLYPRDNEISVEKIAYKPSLGVPGLILSLSFSPDGVRIAAAHMFGVTYIWDARGGQLLRTLKSSGNLCTSVAYSPDGRKIVSAGNGIDLWDAQNGTLFKTLNQHTDYVNVVKFSPDGRFIASASNDRTIMVWDAINGSLLRTLSFHSSGVNSVAYSQDGRFIVSSSIDTSVKIHSAYDGVLIGSITTFNDGNWVSYTPDYYFKASAGVDSLLAWRLSDKIYPFSSYKSAFNRPDIVSSRFRGISLPSLDSAKPVTPAPVVASPTLALSGAERGFMDRWGKVRYYALVIGNANYKHSGMTQLKTPIKDATDVSAALKNEYGFEVQTLLDATRKRMLVALDQYRETLSDDSCLLIYYAGHGYFDAIGKTVYWQPIDASQDDSSDWISAQDIFNRIRGLKARHILLVADSCFSGGLLVDVMGNPQDINRKAAYFDDAMKLSSRHIMTSGGLEFVDDNGPYGRSIFTHSFLEGLRSMQSNVFTAEMLFYEKVKNLVMANSGQEPKFGLIRDPVLGDQFINTGQFVFIRRR